MLIEMRIDRTAARLWHLRLLERLVKVPGPRVVVSWGPPSEALPGCIALLFALERLVNGLPSEGLASDIAENAFLPYALEPTAKSDLVIDLCGTAQEGSAPIWRVTFDGLSGDAAALNALVSGRFPVVEVLEVQTGETVASGRPGTEAFGIVLSAFEDCLARVITLVVAAVNGAGIPKPLKGRPGPGVQCMDVAKFATKTLARKTIHRLYTLCCFAPHWRVGWRFVEGPDTIDLLALPHRQWNNLPDDGFHFYADPFPLVAEGHTFLFVEEFDHRCGRGAIAVAEFDNAGPRAPPRTVLATDKHLSYPFVFEHAGEFWMTPECTAAGRIDLYRAARFPYVWEFAATLVAGVEASDPTLFQDDRGWWMMATVRDEGGSFSDALYLWSSLSLLGPWIPHARNPVLIDIAAARPAGRVVRRGGRLIRPAQDCARGYGAAVVLAEITRLDDKEFDQQVLATLRPGDLWPGRRLHTLNRAGNLECIDGSAIAMKMRLRTKRTLSDPRESHGAKANGVRASV